MEERCERDDLSCLVIFSHYKVKFNLLNFLMRTCIGDLSVSMKMISCFFSAASFINFQASKISKLE